MPCIRPLVPGQASCSYLLQETARFRQLRNRSSHCPSDVGRASSYAPEAHRTLFRGRSQKAPPLPGGRPAIPIPLFGRRGTESAGTSPAQERPARPWTQTSGLTHRSTSSLEQREPPTKGTKQNKRTKKCLSGSSSPSSRGSSRRTPTSLLASLRF